MRRARLWSSDWRGLSDDRLQIFQVSEAGAKGFSNLHCLLNECGATVLKVSELALGKLLLILNRCTLDLRALESLPRGRRRSCEVSRACSASTRAAVCDSQLSDDDLNSRSS